MEPDASLEPCGPLREASQRLSSSLSPVITARAGGHSQRLTPALLSAPSLPFLLCSHHWLTPKLLLHSRWRQAWPKPPGALEHKLGRKAALSSVCDACIAGTEGARPREPYSVCVVLSVAASVSLEWGY